MRLGKQVVSIRSLIRKNWLDTEMRVNINRPKVAQYASEKADGAIFPDPVVFIDRDERCWVGDGFHRILAEQANGAKSVQVDLRRGGFRDAFLHNIQANKEQKGLPFVPGDLRRCLFTLMYDKETAGWSLSRMAEFVGCSSAYASKVEELFQAAGGARPETTTDSIGRIFRKRPRFGNTKERREEALKMRRDGWSVAQIAEHFGIAVGTAHQDIKLAMTERRLVKCPHCKGTGMIAAQRSRIA